MAYDGSLIFNTQVDSKGFQTGLSALNSMAKSGMLAVTAAIASVAASMGGAAAAAIKVGSDFEAGMSKVEAISGASGQELTSLTEKAKEMGAKTKFSATEAASAFEYMAMAGWKTADMLGGIEGIMSLAAASGESLALTSDIVTDAMTAFGMAASESGRFADVLASASSNSNTNVAMMGATFKYVAPVAGALGYSVEDTAVAIGLMANAGIKADTAGTALRGTLTNLAKPSNEVAGYMEDLGISLTDTSGEVKPLNQLILELRDRFSGLTKAQKAEYAAGIAGKEAMSGLLAIVSAGDDDFEKLTEAINNSEGAAKRMAEVMQNNLQGSMTVLGSTVEGLGIAFYDNIKVSATEAVNTLIKTLSGHAFRSAFDSLAKSSGKMIESLSKIAKKAIPAVASAFAFLAENLKEVVGVVGAVYLAFKSYSVISSATQLVLSMSKAWSTAALQIGMYTVANGAAALSQAALKGTLTLTEVVVATLTGKITLATAAQAAWNMVLAANPVGLLVAALGALAVGILTYVSLTKDGADATDELLEHTEELVSSSKDLRTTMQDNTEARKKEREEMEKQVGGARKLADEIFELAGKTNKTAGEKKALLSMVEQLNKAIPGLNLLYDAENDKLNKQKGEIQGVITATLEMLKAKAAEEDLIKISEDLYQVEKKRNELAIARSKIQTEIAFAEHELMKAITDTNNAYAVTDLMQEYKMNVAELEDQLSKATEEEHELASVTASLQGEFDTATAYIQKTTEATDKAEDSLNAVGEAGTGAADDIAEASESIYESLNLTDDQTKDLSKNFEEYGATAKSAFDAIGENVDLTVDQMIENLRKNQEAMNSWADNLILAAERGLDKGLLEQMRAMGPESSKLLQDVVNLSGEKFDELQEVYRSGAEAAANAHKAELAILTPDTETIISETISGAVNKFHEGVPSIKQAGLELKNSAVEGVSSLPEEYAGIADSAAKGMIAGLKSRVGDIAQTTRDFANSLVNAAKKKFEVNSPSKLTMREIGEPFAEGIGKGIERGFPNVASLLDGNIEDLTSKMRLAVASSTAELGMRFSSGSARSYSSSSHTNNFNITVPSGGSARDQLDARAVGKQIGAETHRELRSRGVVVL